MYCSKCGKQNNSNNKFCDNCGNPMNNIVNNTNTGSDISLILGIVCLVSSLFINIFCFIPGIISIIYAVKKKRETGKLGVGFGLSLGGMIFSFIVLILYVLLVLFIIGVGVAIDDYDGNYSDNDVEYTYNLPNV